MRNSKDVHFSILDGDSLDHNRKDLLCAAVVEYVDFLIIANSSNLLIEVSQYIHAAVEIRPSCILVPSSTLLATAENFLDHAYLHFDAGRRFFKLNLDDGSLEEATQLRRVDFTVDVENRVHSRQNLQRLHPIVRNMVESACAQHNEFASLVSRLLVGYSFLPDTLLKSKSTNTDLDGLQLQELKAFIDHIQNIGHGLTLFQGEITSLLSYCNTLLSVRPASATDLSNSHPTAALQNGYPCVYKVMSVLHYLGYQLSMRRKLYNKAFMHIFRTYECYASGVLFLHNARIDNYISNSGTRPDAYILGNKLVQGFGPVFKGIGVSFNMLQNSDYQTCKFYLELRNKFHYTHGDVKPSENLLLEFSRSVLRQIIRLEKASNQQTFLWKDVYQQTKEKLMADASTVVRAAITRELQVQQLAPFMIP